MTTIPAPQPVKPHAAPPGAARQAMRTVYLLTLVELLVDAAVIAPVAVTLSLKVLALEPHLAAGASKESALALVTIVGAVAALVLSPVFGYLSDRTRSRYGRRRPAVVAGAVALVPASAVMALATSVPVLAIGWGLTTAAQNLCVAALFGWIADAVPDEQRAKASGIFGAGNIMGLVPALAVTLALKDHLSAAFLVMPVVAAVATLLVVPLLRDPSTATADLPPARWRELVTSLAFSPRRHPQFALVLVQRFVVQLGYMLLGTFGLYYLMERLLLDRSAATTTTSLTSLVTGLLSGGGAFLLGFVAARRRDYTIFLVGSVVGIAVAAFLRAFTDQMSWFWIGSVISGLALGAFYAIDLALVLRTVPADESARFLGIFAIAKTLPQSLAPAIAPTLLLVGSGDLVGSGPNNYAALYGVAGAVALLSLVPLRWTTALRGPLPAEGTAPAALPVAVAAAPTPEPTPDLLPEPAPALSSDDATTLTLEKA